MVEYAVGVCGYGRCGSSMVMEMLHAGGVTIAGGLTFPPYEFENAADMWDRGPFNGAAVKLLSNIGYEGAPPAGAATAWRFVWLDRDADAQARSMIKLLNWGEPLPIISPSYRRDLAIGLRADRAAQVAALRQVGAVTAMRYEAILRNPTAAANRLRADLWPSLDVKRAAAVVHKRTGACRPDMSVEEAGVLAGSTGETGQ